MTRTVCDNVEHNVLIIDHDPQVVRVILQCLAQNNFRGIVAKNKQDADKYIDRNIWSMAFVNPTIAENNRSYFLNKIKRQSPELPVIMLSEINSAQSAVNALRQGYAEVLIKPVDQQDMEGLINTFLPNHKAITLAITSSSNQTPTRIIGSSAGLTQTVCLAKKAAPTSVPILITGPSGTGKELIAQLIHDHSQRSKAPFIKLNCAALNDSLLESELFGHEKGAFTGAAGQHRGRFERAHGGTLLLDEITETKPPFQAKLLRVLEQMNFERVGGTESINVNVRLISTTNTDILAEVEKGRFRSDLYYRLAGIRVIVPSLKDRVGDITQLVWFYINQFAPETKRNITDLDPAMLDIFSRYHWPGNVRQLRNVVRTALILGSGSTLSLADVSWLVDELQPKCQTDEDFYALAGQTLRELEQKAILATLQETEGNQTKAAKVLGISDRTLRDKIKKYRQQDLLELTN